MLCPLEVRADPYASCCALTEHDAGGMPTTGCLPVVACALATGCVHAECYEPDTCMAEIDGAGGLTGDATAAAGPLGNCVAAAVAAAASDACMECQAMD